MSSSSSSCPLPWPSTTPCSGHGDCVDSSCVCDVGFLSLGDFATIEGADCDINVVAVRVLYGVSLIPALGTVVFSLRYLWLRRESIRESRGELSWLDAINFAPILALLASLSLVGLAVVRISYPELAVGNSGWATFFLGVLFLAFWSAQCVLLHVFLNLAAKQSRVKSSEFRDKVKKRLLSLRRYLVGVVAVTFIWAFVPLLLLAYPTAVGIIAPFHYIGAAFNIVLLAFVVLPNTVQPIRDDIREALKINNDKKSPKAVIDVKQNRIKAMQEAEKKLTQTTDFVKRSAVQEAIIACVFALWPFLLRKASYQLPITWTVAEMILIFEIHSIFNFKKKTPSEDGGGPTKLKAGQQKVEMETDSASQGVKISPTEKEESSLIVIRLNDSV